jgi:hypothetical protein
VPLKAALGSACLKWLKTMSLDWQIGLSGSDGTMSGRLEMTKRRIALNVIVAGSALALTSMTAFAFSQKVKDACSADYGSLCAKYKQGSSELRRCFESNRRVLSTECVQALVDAGEVPARYLKERH